MKHFLLYIFLIGLTTCFTACETKQEPEATPTQDQIEAKWPSELVTEMGTFVKVQRDTTGFFYMGDSLSNISNEKPAHRVNFSKSFYMCTLEVTQSQWESIMGKNPSDPLSIGNNLPVNNISYNDVSRFIKELNKQTGRTYRLPTEAEWEYAATGGILTNNYTYSGSNNIDEVAWYIKNTENLSDKGPEIQPVGTKKANELGIFDMSGNVEEWCNDKQMAYTENEVTDPKGSQGTLYAIRGGNFELDAFDLRVKSRGVGGAASYKAYNLGFRLVLSEPLATEILP